MLKSAINGIVSNFHRLSNSADFSKMSTKQNRKFLTLQIWKNCETYKIIQHLRKPKFLFFWIVFRWLSQFASPRPLHHSLHLQEAGWSNEAASRGTQMLLFKGRLAVSSSARPRPLPRPLRHHVQVWVLRTRPPRKI